MDEKVFFINDRGLKLCGILSTPHTPAKKCIILCHGFGMNKDEWEGIFVRLAGRLVEKGFAVLRFDFAGHGESEGKSTDMTFTTEKRDVEAAYAYVLEKGFAEIGIVAASFAGTAVALFASGKPEKLKTVVFYNSLLNPKGLLTGDSPKHRDYWSTHALQQIKEKGYAEIGSKKFRIGPALLEEANEIEPIGELATVEIPMLFIHGDADSFCNYNVIVDYSKKVKHGTLHTIYGAEHGFWDNPAHGEEADTTTIEFLLKNV